MQPVVQPLFLVGALLERPSWHGEVHHTAAWCRNDLKAHVDTLLELWHVGDNAHQPPSPLQIDQCPKNTSQRLAVDESQQILPRASMLIHMSTLPVYPTVVFVKYVSSSFRWRS